jgi:hypothetical protein
VPKGEPVRLTHLAHRKVNQNLLQELEDMFPEFEFHVKNVVEKQRLQGNQVPKANRIIIYVDSENYIVGIPTNG